MALDTQGTKIWSQRESVVAWSHKGGTIGGTAAALADADCYKGVSIKADDDNSGSIYVGNAGTVTADAGNATSGYRLKAGQSLFIPVCNTNLVYLIGSAADQKYSLAWA